MAGVHVHVAVPYEQRLRRLHRQIPQQGVDARRVRLHRDPLDLSPHQLEHTGEKVLHDIPAEAVCLVGVDRQGNTLFLQAGQELRDAGIGPGLVQIVGAVVLRELGDGAGQQQGAAAPLR